MLSEHVKLKVSDIKTEEQIHYDNKPPLPNSFSHPQKADEENHKKQAQIRNNYKPSSLLLICNKFKFIKMYTCTSNSKKNIKIFCVF